MSHVSPFIPEQLQDYFLSILPPEPEAMKALREETDQLDAALMRIPYEQALFLQFLIKTTRSQSILELGTFTGYSALAMALALPESGKILTCDISDRYRYLAEQYWQRGGVQEKIKWRIGTGVEILSELLEQGSEFDFIFIDADKLNYPYYYETCLKLLRSGGTMAMDNTLWFGRWVSDENRVKKPVLELNAMLKADRRIDLSILTIGGGLSLIHKK